MLKHMQSYDVILLSQVPKGCPILQSKMDMKTTKDALGRIAKHKARLGGGSDGTDGRKAKGQGLDGTGNRGGSRKGFRVDQGGEEGWIKEGNRSGSRKGIGVDRGGK